MTRPTYNRDSVPANPLGLRVEMFKNPHVITVTSTPGQLFFDARATTSLLTTIYPRPATMSSRRKSRRVTKADVDYKEYENSGPSEDETVAPAAKRRKTATSAPKKTTKRVKGKLSRLPDMPLDVLYEVNLNRRR